MDKRNRYDLLERASNFQGCLDLEDEKEQKTKVELNQISPKLGYELQTTKLAISYKHNQIKQNKNKLQTLKCDNKEILDDILDDMDDMYQINVNVNKLENIICLEVSKRDETIKSLKEELKQLKEELKYYQGMGWNQ